MSKRFKDTNGAGASVINKSDRMKLIGHLQDASASVPDAGHVVHGHLLKAANTIGAVEDRSEDRTGARGDLTSPGTSQTYPSRVGQATSVPVEIAARSQRAFELHKKSLQQTGAARKATLDAMDAEYDEIDRLRKHSASESMTETDVAALRGNFGEEATKAALNKAQAATANKFQPIFQEGGKPSGDRRTFAGRHGG